MAFVLLVERLGPGERPDLLFGGSLLAATTPKLFSVILFLHLQFLPRLFQPLILRLAVTGLLLMVGALCGTGFLLSLGHFSIQASTDLRGRPPDAGLALAGVTTLGILMSWNRKCSSASPRVSVASR